MGQVAVEQGDRDAGVRALEKAHSILDDEGPSSAYSSSLGPHVRFSLASAYSRAERTDQAKRVLECIVEDKGALLNWPIPYIRSFFLLGREHRVLGDASNAQKYFQRFLRYWKDGELDSNQVKEAEREAMSPPGL